jgi:undecaprenyl-diphosphatase
MAEMWPTLQMLDTWGFRLINHAQQNPVFDVLMRILSTKRYFIFPAALVILALALRGGRRMQILLAVCAAAVALSDQGANLIKEAVQRTRPCHVMPEVSLLAGCTDSAAFPSNHASNMFAIATMAWLEFRRWRWVLPALAAAMAYSRVYVGVHYPGDVMAGAFWGAAIGWACTAMVARTLPEGLGGRVRGPRRCRLSAPEWGHPR